MITGLLSAMMAAAKRSAEERERCTGAAVLEAASLRAPRGADFKARLAGAGISIIAECKSRSPSRGIIRHPYDPGAIARGYAAAGAAAISVLTEPTCFDGSLQHLSAVRDHVDVPVLRKDFISTSFQISEARAAGADAVLLIVAGLGNRTLVRLIADAEQEGLAALVEVHTKEELVQALGAGADVIGVNSRNLKTLAVDLHVLDELVLGVPSGVTAVAESGLRTASDLRRLSDAGYDAFLIGERFMTASDPGEALAGLLAEAQHTVTG